MKGVLIFERKISLQFEDSKRVFAQTGFVTTWQQETECTTKSNNPKIWKECNETIEVYDSRISILFKTIEVYDSRISILFKTIKVYDRILVKRERKSTLGILLASSPLVKVPLSKYVYRYENMAKKRLIFSSIQSKLFYNGIAKGWLEKMRCVINLSFGQCSSMCPYSKAGISDVYIINQLIQLK